MGFRHEVYHLEWFCITFMTFTFPIEYLVSIIIVLVTFPVAGHFPIMQLNIFDFFTLDLSISYLILLYVSVPYFLSTLVYVCRKRTYQLQVKEIAMKQKREQRARQINQSLSDDDSQ